MGRILILIRHAQAESPRGGEDIDRKLTPMGERDARHVGRWLAKKLKKVDTVVCSTAKRAQQTAEIIVEEFRQNNVIILKDDVYEASIRMLLVEVNNLKATWNTVMVVGHNPAISYLADFLTGAPLESMSPGSVAIIDLGETTWEKAGQHSAVSVEQKSPGEAT